VLVKPYCDIGRSILEDQLEIMGRLDDWFINYSGTIKPEDTAECAEFHRAEEEAQVKFDEHCERCHKSRTTIDRFYKRRPQSLMS
jgi:hypothetical protein